MPAEDIAPPVAEAEATVVPAEPEFDEVWFPAGRHGGNKARHAPRRNSAPAEAEAGAEGRPSTVAIGTVRRAIASQPTARSPPARIATVRRLRCRNGNGQHRRDAGKPRFDNRGKPFDKGGVKDFDKPKFQAPPREKREVAFDPDSPFAALAVLRNRKPE